MTGFVYFVTNGTSIKIGFSEQPGRRFNNLKGGNDKPLKFLGCTEGTRDNEKKLHKELSGFRLEGEWFVDCAPVRDRIARALKRGLPKINKRQRTFLREDEDADNLPLQLRNRSENLEIAREKYFAGQMSRAELVEILAEAKAYVANAIKENPWLTEAAGSND